MQSLNKCLLLATEETETLMYCVLILLIVTASATNELES